MGPKVDLDTVQIAKSLGRISYSEVEEFFTDILRRQVLSGGERSLADILRGQTKLWAGRARTALVQSKDDIDAGSSTP